MASGRKSRRAHKRTESQAISELDNVFKSVDLEGDGKLDKASFSTAMFSLDLMLEDEKLEEVFEQIDNKDRGYIDYEEFLSFLKNGDSSIRKSMAANTLIGAARSMPGSYASANQLLAPGSSQGAGAKSVSAPHLSTLGAFAPKPKKKKLDPKKKQAIQRAVIVIKKAAMKNISRDEVMEFLKDKGMSTEDIEYAYEKAQEQAMSPEERIRYLKGRLDNKEKEIEENKAFTRHLNSQVSEAKEQVKDLQRALLKAAEKLEESYKETVEAAVPAKVKTELKDKVTALQKDMKSLSKGKSLIQADMKKLMKVLNCVEKNMLYHAYLFYMTLEPMLQTSLPATGSFLAEFALDYSEPTDL